MGQASSVGKREASQDMDYCDSHKIVSSPNEDVLQIQHGGTSSPKSCSSSIKNSSSIPQVDDHQQQAHQNRKKNKEKPPKGLKHQILNDDVISIILSFLDVKSQLFVCASSKTLYDNFIQSNLYNKYFYECAVQHAIPSLFPFCQSSYEWISKECEKLDQKRTDASFIAHCNHCESFMWRRFIYLLTSSQVLQFSTNLGDLVVEENGYFASLQAEHGFGNFSFSLNFSADYYQDVDSFQREYLVNCLITQKNESKNVAIGLGDHQVLDMSSEHRFLGYPPNTLSYSSDGNVKFNIIEGPCVTSRFPSFKAGDIVSMFVSVYPLQRNEESLYRYRVFFFLNGVFCEQQAVPTEFVSLCPLFPSFTLHCPSDSLRLLCNPNSLPPGTDHTTTSEQHKLKIVVEKLFKFYVRYRLQADHEPNTPQN
ncbi:hypothetical protein C9374_005544 [Naegleria lovaniensis]|uniref:F-box domain-containing protein n=1 Tax=Naegleria lovaniensis TaxID=51637 RepID=A0AA88GQ55_NAELO|nr:uncharacterized protein C9374_005544 [Naegleria lovaniensis]KAG2382342.1 hypothetical protein C9374_005544 [Naegleria lovaniensis]